MHLEMMAITEADIPQYKRDMQEAFQLGAIEGGYPMDSGEVILPETDIDRSLQKENAIAYKAVYNGEIVGGAIVVTDADKHLGELEFLYVKHGVQSRGIGKFMWFEIEKRHPHIRVWETCTPYFEKRNLHFYINVCGFHVTEYWNSHHRNPHDGGSDDSDGMFAFRKEIR